MIERRGTPRAPRGRRPPGRERPGRDLGAARSRRRGAPSSRGEPPGRVHLDGQRAPAAPRASSSASAGRHRRLADAALADDEVQPALEQRRRASGSRRRGGRRASTFVPPKPKELDSAASTLDAAGAVRHVVEVARRIGLVEVDRGRQDAAREREHGVRGLDRAGRAEQVAGHRLGRADGEARRRARRRRA